MSALDTTPKVPAARACRMTAELAERFGVAEDTVYMLAATAGLVGPGCQQPNARALSAHGRVGTENRSTFLP